jgi:hypothetical protein
MSGIQERSPPAVGPGRQRKMMRPPKAKSKPVDFEPEIGRTDDIRGRTNNNKRPIVPPRRIVAKLTDAIAYWRKLITLAARPEPRGQERVLKRKKLELRSGRVGRATALGISICFGLLVVCGIMIAALFTQIRDMKADIAFLKQHLAASDTHLSRLEEITQQKVIKEAKIPETPASPPHMQITLSNDDMKVIRASIKVLPSEPGAQQKMHLGQEISNASTVPVPESLVSKIPKLRGARFLVDENGAIIIIGEGSNHADVVVETQ